jgi:preprotein translocase SecE subunit
VAESKASSKKKRQLKKPETVRQRAEKAGVERKPRRIKQAGTTAAKPVKAVGRGIAKLLRPFRFLLRPFRTRPARFIGRILKKILLLNYFRESWREVKLVEWPNRKQTAKLTFAVFMFAIFFSVLIGVVDYGLDKLFKQLILK